MLTLFALLLVITTTYSDGAGAALACDKTAAEIKAITDATVATLRNKNLRHHAAQRRAAGAARRRITRPTTPIRVMSSTAESTARAHIRTLATRSCRCV